MFISEISLSSNCTVLVVVPSVLVVVSSILVVVSSDCTVLVVVYTDCTVLVVVSQNSSDKRYHNYYVYCHIY